MFKNLNVVEILRLGLSGLVFLFALLAYGLITTEQGRDGAPRGEILTAIYVFMGFNLLASVFALASTLLSRRQLPARKDELSSDSYLVDYTSYLVDLTKWAESTLGPVSIIRTDFVRKVGDTSEPYVIPYFTTGDAIKCEPISYSSRPLFAGPKNDPDRTGLHYDYILPIEHQPVGYSEMVSSQFTFPSGFKNPTEEWWQASVAYPTRTLTVVFRFPPSKPCKDIAVSRIEGIKAKRPISSNIPVRSEGGQIVQWVGLNYSGNMRIQFDWKW